MHASGPWKYTYASAAQARKENPGTDGGGASGSISRPNGKFLFGSELHDTIAFLPHHRDPKEDKEREANARLMAKSPELLTHLRDVLMMCSGYLKQQDPLLLADCRKTIAEATGKTL